MSSALDKVSHPDPSRASRSDQGDQWDLSSLRVGLVLAGGGAKGAYQAGCLDYLQQIGVHSYKVITGTSVGSLNGAAAASDKVSELVALWRGISISKVMRASWRAMPSLIGLFLAGLLIHIPLILWGILIGGIIGWSIGSTFWSILIGALIAFCVYILAPVGPAATVVLKYIGKRTLSRTTRHTSFAKNTKLRHMIEDALFPNGEEHLIAKCPIIVTAAYRTRWFDPDFPAFYPDDPTYGYIGSMAHINYHRPAPIAGYLPEYFDLAAMPREDALSFLLASAALPGAFRRTKIEGTYWVDGGVVENVPLNKALEYQCDLIIVIYLAGNERLPHLTLAQVPRLRRALRLAKMDIRESHALYLRWLRGYYPDLNDDEWEEQLLTLGLWDVPRSRSALEAFPCEPLTDLPPLIHVVPSQPLGGLLRGTLNFRRRKAERLIALGRADMRRAINSYATRRAHYVPEAELTRALTDGVPAIALCGKQWIPSTREVGDLPICDACTQASQMSQPD